MSDPDPRNLIAEAYRIDGISEAECRTIFLNWAISAPDTGLDAIQALQARHSDGTRTHPMDNVLAEAAKRPPNPQRRGGRNGRPRPADS